MNRVLIIIAALFFTSCSEQGNKYFTGTIEYAYTYTSDSLNADSLARTRPSKSILRYDILDYQSKFITNNDTTINYYSGTLNKCLIGTNGSKNFECADYSSFTDSVLSYKIYNTDEKILGYSCRILEVQKKNSWLQYYVSNDLRIASATYRKHVSYNWDFYGDKANGGLILRSEHRFKYFTMKGIATAIEMKPADFKALEISEDLFPQFCK